MRVFHLVGFVALCAFASLSHAADAPSYSQVHAIFAKHCLSCHDAKQAEGELVMETLAGLMKGGDKGPPIIPGKSGESLLVQQIEHTKKPFMPPPKKGDKLSDEDIATIRAWIDAGAHGPKEGEPLPDAPVNPVIPKIQPKGPPRFPVRAIAYAPSRKLLAIAKGSTVELISADERVVVRRLEGHHGSVNALAFSPDGSRLATGAGELSVAGEVKLWNIADGSLLRTIEGHKDSVYSVAISPDGKTLATGSYDQKIDLWNLDDGKRLRELDGHNGAVMALAFRPDGVILASASADRTVKLWDVAGGKRLDTFSESLKELNTLAFSPDGQRVAAAGADNRIRVWHVSAQATEGSNSILYAQFAHEGAILHIAYSADGKTLVSSADDKTVKVWDAADMKEKHVLPAQPDWPVALSLALDDKTVIVGRLDGTTAFYDVNTGGEIAPPKPELAAIFPRGIQHGRPERLKLMGKHLASLIGVKFSDAKLTGRPLPDESATADTAWVEVTSSADLAPGAYTLSVNGPGGESGSLTIWTDDLPQVQESEPNDVASHATVAPLPASIWGGFGRRGDVDCFAFEAKAGQHIICDAAARRIGSKAEVVLTLLDAGGKVLSTSHGLDSDPDALISYTIPADGRYIVRVSELQAAASNEHFYRLSIGSFAYVTGCHPLAVAPNAETKVQLVGFNLPSDSWAAVKAGANGEAAVPIDAVRFRSRRALNVMVGSGAEPVEVEPNNEPAQAMKIEVPGAVDGRIDTPGDVDLYRFDAKAGQKMVIETIAARRGSPVDTKIEVLHPDGKPVERVVLRAVRDSAITFRPFDANAGGARLINWEEMSLNQYLYLQGEVVKLFLSPRGPDSEYGFYTLGGRRRCYFDTSATAHSLDEVCYIVEPHAPGEKLPPNGLPSFPIYYTNDDDELRQLGSDSRLMFTAPADGSYLVRVSDVRGFGGDRFTYRLVVRPAKPDFNVSIALSSAAIPAGAGRSFSVNLDRIDGFDDPVRLNVAGAPAGFSISTPIVIEAGHTTAKGTIFAAADAPPPSSAEIKFTATASIGGQSVSKLTNDIGKITLAPKPQLMVALEPVAGAAPGQTPEITLIPGQLVPAKLRVERNGFTGEITFEVDNLPHGAIVADIGLNGVLIPENQTERQIFLSCAPWVPDADRPCYAIAQQAGTPTSRPAMIHVRRPVQQAAGR